MKPASNSGLSVIVPALNEGARLGATLASIRGTLPGAEIIVAPADSSDGTAAVALSGGARLAPSGRGRGRQCQAGALAAGAGLLLFLHADTLLPADAGEVIGRHFARPEVRIATFRLAFDGAGPLLRFYAWWTRWDSVFTRFGDQGIVVRRDFHAELGGFPPWPLFEDVELLRRARRMTRVWSLPASVTTSARRFTRGGGVRQQLRNGWLLAQFLLGASPDRLATRYGAERTE